MTATRDPLEVFWDAILSRQPEQILAAFTPLDSTQRQQLIAHLQRMVTESGWQPEQRESARAALDILTGRNHPDPS